MFPHFLNPLRVRSYLRLRQAQEHYRQKPGAEETLALAHALVETGDCAGALRYLKSARRRFPRSGEIRELHSSLWAETADVEIKGLERAWRRRRQPEDLARLIELHRSVKNFDRSLELSSEGQEEFPDSWLIHLAAGKAFYHRSLCSRSLEDAEEAARCLRLAHELKPDSARALLYLSAVLIWSGEHEEARAAASELARLAPHSPQLKELQGRLRALRAPPQFAAQEPATRPEAQDAVDTLLEELRASADVCGAFVFDKGGEVIREHCRTNALFALEGRAAQVAALSRAVKGSTERMGIGRLQTCVIEGSPWWIYFAEVSGKGLVVFTLESFKPSRFEGVLSRLSVNVVTI